MEQVVFNDVKILDFTTEMGSYTTKLFADLGAEVVKIEPLIGDSTRRIGPYLQNQESEETSLYYYYLNTNKKSIVLNIETEEGQKIVKDLVKEFDIIIENFQPGLLAKLGLDYETLKAINPRLIFTSLTAFGQTGPKKDFVANDLVGIATGGLMYLGGYPDTSPIRPYGNQAYFCVSLFAAIATMLALLHRDNSGEGQYIDVSMQEAVAMALENAVQFYDLEKVVRVRTGAEDRQAGWGLYPCADGEVYIMTAGLSNAGGWENLVNWMVEDGVKEAEALKDPKWHNHEWRATSEARQQFLTIFKTFAGKYKKLYLYEQGQQRKVPICPVNQLPDVLENPQLHARNFFKQLQHEDMGEPVVYTGPPYYLSATKWALKTVAPKLGQHTEEILGSYIWAKEEMQ